MRMLLTRGNVALGTAVVTMVGFVGQAMAAGGAAPTFDTSTLAPTINDYASSLLTGVIVLLGVVLVAIVPFVLVKLGIKYIKKWFGAGKATATA